ncbi:MAG: TIGR00730 family Rossman fold protein [Tepidisphaeraceae bacterium]
MGVQDDTDLPHQTTQPPIALSRAEVEQVHQTANVLIGQLAHVPDGDLIGQMVANALLLLRNETNRGDLKLINKSLQEMRYALKVFAPYRNVRKVSIFGSARTPQTDPDYAQAAAFGKAMAAAGWMVITGAGGGIMAAGHGGGGAEASFGLAIRLPFEQRTNAFIANDPKLIHFKYFFTRKLMFVRFSDAIALFPGGFGTMDEGFEVLTLVQTGKSVPMPIVFIDSAAGGYWDAWQEYVRTQLLGRGLIGENDLHLYKITRSVDDAAAEIRRFYSNYHSIRYTRDAMAMRLHRAPNAAQLEHIRAEFKDIAQGGYEVTGALPVERDEPDLAAMARLVFNFNRRDHGRLRQLIDYLNSLPS